MSTERSYLLRWPFSGHHVLKGWPTSQIKLFLDSNQLYRNIYISHVLIGLIKEWKKSVDIRNIVGAVLMDLSEAFGCNAMTYLLQSFIPMDYLNIAFVYSCLMWIKEGLKTNHVEPLFRLLLSGVFQGSILYLILFNNFTFDLLMFIKEANRANFADGNTFNILSKDIKILINLSEKEIEIAIKWSEENNMVVNQWKRQTFVSKRRSKSNCHSTLKINKWITEAVVQRGSVKKMFLKISQNSQENNTCDRVSFLKKLQNLGL